MSAFAGTIPVKNHVNCDRERAGYMLQIQTQKVFFEEMLVCLKLFSLGLFGTNRAYHHLETRTFQEVFL
jgi:hypothetical protein